MKRVNYFAFSAALMMAAACSEHFTNKTNYCYGEISPSVSEACPETNYPQSSRLTVNCICFGSHKSIHWSDRYQCLYSEGFPCSSVGKESACNAGDPGLTPGSGRSLGEGNGNPLQYSCLENLMDGEAW